MLSNDEIAQRLYERREMAIYDMNTLERNAMQRGLRKGRVDIARNLKTLGLSVELIAQSTRLSAAEIEKL